MSSNQHSVHGMLTAESCIQFYYQLWGLQVVHQRSGNFLNFWTESRWFFIFILALKSFTHINVILC